MPGDQESIGAWWRRNSARASKPLPCVIVAASFCWRLKRIHSNRVTSARRRHTLVVSNPNASRERIMAGRPRSSFTCPNCEALYEIVRVEAGPETDSREIVCRACGAPLAARDGRFVLKYFLLRKGLRSRRRA
jgi:hypothetical protein